MTDSAGGKGVTPASDRDSRRPAGKSDEVGRVLRTVYDDTLREDVPDEFKDLLRKLK